MSSNRGLHVAAAAAAFAVGVASGGAAAWASLRPNSSNNSSTTDTPAEEATPTSPPPSLGPKSEVLINEQLSRNIAMLGRAGVQRIRDSFVIVCGLGGVGSHCANMLVRSGVERVRLIDFDQVSLSSLNRHATATREDVGMSKVGSMAAFFARILPHTVIEPVDKLFCAKDAEELLSGKPDFVVDCIDNTPTKVELIQWCVENNIPIISSMGAGARMDATRIHLSDISETRVDPLAKAIRTRLRKLGIQSGVPVVFSSESPVAKLLELEGEPAEEPEEFAILPNFRTRILPVVGTLPAVFGNVLATYVLSQLSGKPIIPAPLPTNVDRRVAGKVYRELIGWEKRNGTKDEEIMVTASDVLYALEEMWNHRSVFSGVTMGVTLVRWDASQPLHVNNMIALTTSEASKFRKGSLTLPPKVIRKVEATIALEMMTEDKFNRHLVKSVDGSEGELGGQQDAGSTKSSRLTPFVAGALCASAVAAASWWWSTSPSD